jgi:DNA-binding response OmpR family regulator
VIVRVLVIEDDAELAETIAVFLRRRQLAVDVALDGRGGLDRALFTSYDVVVLDRDLPGLHGDDVCAEIAAASCRSRVLMLTAAASVDDRVDGLDKGADDYLPKPFALAELAARIRAQRPRWETRALPSGSPSTS